jgi:hypothetical protein
MMLESIFASQLLPSGGGGLGKGLSKLAGGGFFSGGDTTQSQTNSQNTNLQNIISFGGKENQFSEFNPSNVASPNITNPQSQNPYGGVYQEQTNSRSRTILNSIPKKINKSLDGFTTTTAGFFTPENIMIGVISVVATILLILNMKKSNSRKK